MESQVFKHVYAAPQAGRNWIVATSPWYADYLNMAETPTNLGARTASGTMWMASQTIITRFTSLASQVVLARLLLKEDFGRIGLVYTITAFIIQLTNPGIDEVLLQKQKHLYRWTTAAFWFGIFSSVAGAILMIAIAAIVVAVAAAAGNEAYGNPMLIRLVAILAISTPLNTATVVPLVIMRSELRFARLASISLGDVVLQQLLMVVFAYYGFGAYSFVLPVPIAAAARLAVYWTTVRPKIRWQLSLHRWPSLTASGGWVFGQRTLYTAANQGDYMILAALYANETIIGIYFFAFSLSAQVIRLLCDNAYAALAPALNAIRDDSARMWHASRRASGALAAIVVPVAMLQIVLAGPVLRVLFSGKWDAAIPLVRWLSVGPILYWCIWPMNAVLAATGRFRDNFFLWLIGAISFFLMVTPATFFWGSNGTAASVAAWCWLMAIYYAVCTYRSLAGIEALFAAAKAPILGAAAAAVPALVVVLIIPDGTLGDILKIAIATPAALLIYLSMMRRFDPSSAMVVLNHSPGFLRPLARRFFSIPAV